MDKDLLKKYTAPLFLTLLVFALLLAAGWSSLHGPFYLDSDGYFRSLPYFQDPSLSWGKIVDATVHNPYPGGKRFLPNLSFMIDNALFGFTPASGRVVNMLIHAVNTGLLFVLIRLVLQGMKLAIVRPGALAGASALLWGVNPLFSETVFYVIQRMTLMAATFMLLALILYIAGRGEEGRRRYLSWAGAMLSFVLAILCKENAVLLLPGILLLEFVLAGDSPVFKRRRLALAAAGFLILAPALALLLGHDLSGLVAGIIEPENRFFTTGQRLLTEGRVMIHYLSLMFFPLPGRYTLVMKYPLSYSLISPPVTMLSWLAIIGLITAAVKLRRKTPLFSLAVLWFFLNHAIESTVIPLEIAFLHRNYIPSFFLFLPLAAAFRNSRVPRKALAVCISVALILSAAAWHSRAQAWGSPERFWQDVITKSPGSLRGYINLGIIYDRSGRYAEAMRTYQQGDRNALEEDPGFKADLWVNIAIILSKQGRFKESEIYMENALKVTTNDDYLYNMALLQQQLRQYDKSGKFLARLEKQNPRYPDLNYLKAKYYLAIGREDLAKASLQKEISLYPNNIEARKLFSRLR